MECAICGELANAQYMKCADHFCRTVICLDCLRDYLRYTATDSILPKCVGSKCEALYLCGGLSELGNEALSNYYNACYHSLLRENKNQIEEEMRTKQVVEKLCREKTKYLQMTFPRAIAIVAEITCKSKLSRPPKEEKAKYIHGKLCMNLFCSGVLNENLVCLLCSSQFCKQCEKLLTEGHKCSIEDRESVQVKQSLPRCPQCGINVDKDNGCNDVMCGVCGTKFRYNTGQVGGGGGHTTMIKVNQKIKLVDLYREKLTEEMIFWLTKIENTPIAEAKYNRVKKEIKNILLGKSDNKIRLANLLESYHRRKYAGKRYGRYLLEIENLINQNKLDVNILIAISHQI